MRIANAEAAFAQLYESCHPRVYAYALRRVPPDIAADVVAETFMVAWRRWADVPSEAPLPWLLVVARNTISDSRRRSQRRDALTLEIARANAQAVEPDAESAALERLTVLNALARLSPADREVLFLTVWDGLSSREAARIAECSNAAFAVRLHRARSRLADALEQLDLETGDASVRQSRQRMEGASPSTCQESVALQVEERQ